MFRSCRSRQLTLTCLLALAPIAAANAQADHHSHAQMPPAGGAPSEAGQDAFAALQEMAAALAADPATDWGQVNLLRLREHLVDMHEVVLRAAVEEKPIDGGVEVRVTGAGRTLEAIRRMLPAHARFLAAEGLRPEIRDLPDGLLLAVRADDPARLPRLRALGFFGLLVSGHSHPQHHLALAHGGHPHGERP